MIPATISPYSSDVRSPVVAKSATASMAGLAPPLWGWNGPSAPSDDSAQPRVVPPSPGTSAVTTQPSVPSAAPSHTHSPDMETTDDPAGSVPRERGSVA